MPTPLPLLRMVVGDVLAQGAASLVVTCPFDVPLGVPESLFGFERVVFKSGGDAIADELRRYGPLPPGAAVVTGAGRLSARSVLHVAALGPGGRVVPSALFWGLGAALRLGVIVGADAVALPLLGAGAGGLGADEAAGLAVTAWAAARRKPAETRLVVMTAALAARLGPAWGLDAGGEGAKPR